MRIDGDIVSVRMEQAKRGCDEASGVVQMGDAPVAGGHCGRTFPDTRFIATTSPPYGSSVSVVRVYHSLVGDVLGCVGDRVDASPVRIQCRPAGMWHPADPGMSAHGNGSLLDAVLACPTIVGDVLDCAGMERRLIVSRTHPMSAAASVPPMRRSSESVCIARPREDIATGPFLDT